MTHATLLAVSGLILGKGQSTAIRTIINTTVTTNTSTIDSYTSTQNTCTRLV